MANSETAIDLVRDLIAAGVDPSLIARVSVLAARVADLDRRRAFDAARQQRNRLAKSGDVTLRSVSHVMSRDSRDEGVSQVPLEINSTPPSLPQQSSKPKRVSRSAPANPLPENWFPSEGDLSYARSHGWTESKIAGEAQRFCDHALANNRRQADWAAAWRNWVTSPFQLQTSKGNNRGNEISRGSAGGDRARELAQLAREREAEAGIGRPSDDIASPRGRWEID